MASGYFFLVWACAGFCVYSKGKLIFLFKKKKKDPRRFFFRTGRQGFQTERENEVLEWQVADFGSLIRLTGIDWLAILIGIEQMSHILWFINDQSKRVYITKRGGDESLILDRQQISTGSPPENNFNGFDCYGILGIIQVIIWYYKKWYELEFTGAL